MLPHCPDRKLIFSEGSLRLRVISELKNIFLHVVQHFHINGMKFQIVFNFLLASSMPPELIAAFTSL